MNAISSFDFQVLFLLALLMLLLNYLRYVYDMLRGLNGTPLGSTFAVLQQGRRLGHKTLEPVEYSSYEKGQIK